MRPRAVLTLVVLLVVILSAGCTGTDDGTERSTVTPVPIPDGNTPEQVVTPTPTETDSRPSPTETDQPTTTRTPIEPVDPRVEDDAAEVFDRVIDVLGRQAPENVTRPEVRYSSGAIEDVDRDPLAVDPAFARLLDVDDVAGHSPPIGTVSTDGERVTLVVDNYTARELEHHLAYLYFRAIQERHGLTAPFATHRNGTLDERVIAFATTRGGAAAFADGYLEQFNHSLARNARDWDYAWLDNAWLARPAVATGYDRLVQEVSLVRWIPSRYTNPPRSTEQLMRGFSADVEQPSPLAVSTTDSDWDRTSTDRIGELAIRELLDTRLQADSAATAAAGWGNDRALVFEHEGHSGLVWVVIGDDSSDTDRFVSAVETYAADGTPSPLEVVRFDERGAAVIAGPDPFVEGTTVTGDDENVTVSPPR